jgi:hypothetical protein
MPPRQSPKTPETPPGPPAEAAPAPAPEDQPETLETLAARADHADTMIHTVLTMLAEQQELLVEVRGQLVPDGGQPILPVLHAQLLQVDGKQNGAAGQLQSVFEGTHKITDLLERYGPQIEHAAGFLDNPVQSYLAARKAGKNRAQNPTG